jgi:hypothetical protein
MVATTWSSATSPPLGGVKSGLFFAFEIGGDGVYSLRWTDDDLNADEQEFACAVLPDLGLRCGSGRICASGHGFDDDEAATLTDDLPEGDYRVSVYEVLWRISGAWHDQDGRPRADAPASFVLQAHRCLTSNEPLRASERPLRLDTVWLPGIDPEPEFLYPHPHRRIGTPPGTVLISTVILSSSSPNGLRLNRCGVEQFPVELDDTSGLRWKDRVRFEVLDVDRAAGLIHGRRIEKI